MSSSYETILLETVGILAIYLIAYNNFSVWPRSRPRTMFLLLGVCIIPATGILHIVCAMINVTIDDCRITDCNYGLEKDKWDNRGISIRLEAASSDTIAFNTIVLNNETTYLHMSCRDDKASVWLDTVCSELCPQQYPIGKLVSCFRWGNRVYLTRWSAYDQEGVSRLRICLWVFVNWPILLWCEYLLRVRLGQVKLSAICSPAFT